MRKPDENETRTINGLEVLIETWTDPTDLPYEDLHDDECGPKPENIEGWDIYVKATIENEGINVIGHDSLGGNWFVPDAKGIQFFKDEISNVVKQAVDDAFDQLKELSLGLEVRKAKERRELAKKLCKVVARAKKGKAA